MASFIIEGGRPLRGVIRPIGNKNAALPMLAACLLTDEAVTLHNLPRIGDVHTMMHILGDMGVDIQEQGAAVTLCARSLRTASPDPALFSQIRGSLTMMGPLLARFGDFQVKTSAGGDDIGRRRIDTHLQVLTALGA